MANLDEHTVAGFGDEWQRFDQNDVSAAELDDVFDSYFHIFPWDTLPPNAVGFDLGCGSGRWARRVAPRVGRLHCVDASAEALDVARRMLSGVGNCEFVEASVDAIPLANDSMDFGYSLGVLHHVPDTERGLRDCVRKLKPGAPFLVYLYYAFDNRPAWFRGIWRLSDVVRRGVSRMPTRARHAVADVLAATVYWPASRAALLLERAGRKVDSLPLAAYRNRTFYVMRNDSLDRFGTRLEQRFTRAEIEQMMTNAGLERIRFHDGVPYWCAVGYRAR
jgi:ubiquinone/menaquinone biosynthesis C-methylase UbiE